MSLKPKRILGISAFYHDSAAAIVENGKIIAAAQEERFTRKKHDPSFPVNAVKFVLEYTGLDIDDLDAVAFYDKPLLKLERLLDTYLAFAPRGLHSFITAIPVWLKEKMFLKKVIKDSLFEIMPYNKKKMLLLFPEHHLSHAASTFYVSPFEKSAILTIDGVGEWATATIGVGEGEKISILKETRFPHSAGLLYSAVTYFLGFRVNSGEYKLMGLAPYGVAGSSEVQKFIEIINNNLVLIKPDGSLQLNMEYFDFATGLKMIPEQKWEKLFGFKKRNSEDELLQEHCNLALAIQVVLENIVLLMAKEAQIITECENLCLAGGVALNCVANGKIHDSKLFKNIFITPPSGDAGGSIGAALAAYHIYFEQKREIPSGQDGLNGAFLGPGISESDLNRVFQKYSAKAEYFDDFNKLAKKTAEIIASGKVVGWVQGRMEFGPRALGSRSIIGDPRNPEMQKKLNLKIKYRESFRPFAPSVLSERVSDYFELDDISPYMLLVKKVKKERRLPLPENYESLSVREKLYHLRSDIPSITHIDFSARIQTVHKETNFKYWQLIKEYEKLTGYGVIVNTSFNVRGEPIVCTANDAYRCFMRTEMDYLVIENYLFDKTNQPGWEKNDNWKEDFVLD
ncbi:MAG: carbamoyltransferase [Ignavibacteriaceae bacterium]|nr:carbamoyltransferase [Ignavibacteriaceae bacterium]